mmetsp:Transcript_19755/g.29683  ORF Transcript_19755/g.29683 Transcript_19755/m.29683 type:complete len:80 (-) Transcript_19755:478-717(-)
MTPILWDKGGGREGRDDDDDDDGGMLLLWGGIGVDVDDDDGMPKVPGGGGPAMPKPGGTTFGDCSGMLFNWVCWSQNSV